MNLRVFRKDVGQDNRFHRPAQFYLIRKHKLGSRTPIIEVFNALKDDVSVAICFKVRRRNLKLGSWGIPEKGVVCAKNRAYQSPG